MTGQPDCMTQCAWNSVVPQKKPHVLVHTAAVRPTIPVMTASAIVDAGQLLRETAAAKALRGRRYELKCQG